MSRVGALFFQVTRPGSATVTASAGPFSFPSRAFFLSSMQVRPGLRPVMLCQGVTLTRRLLLVSLLVLRGGRCLRSGLALSCGARQAAGFAHHDPTKGLNSNGSLSSATAGRRLSKHAGVALDSVKWRSGRLAGALVRGVMHSRTVRENVTHG